MMPIGIANTNWHPLKTQRQVLMKKSLIKFSFAATAILHVVNIAYISSAHAQEITKIETVNVTGHYDNAIGTSDAASQGVVNASLIANRPALRVGELLEFVPGMIVSQHSGDGKANQYFLRGFNLDHGTDFASFVDGMPVNMRSHAHGQGYSDLNFLIPELVQRIEYKKGTYFANEGDFASAGAAHIRLADKLDNGTASLSLGKNAYQRAVLVDSIAAMNGQLLYGLELNRNDGPWDNPEKVRKTIGTLRYSEGDQERGYNLTAMAYKNSWNSTDQIPLRAVQSGQISRFGTVDPSDGGNTSRYSLSYAMHSRGPNSLFEMDAYAVQSSLNLFSNFTYFLTNRDDGDQFDQNEQRRMLGINISQAWFNTMEGVEMRNKVGVQYRYDKLLPVGIYKSVGQKRTSTIRIDQVKEASAGFYAENSIQWLAKFRSIAGLRYDTYDFKVGSSIEGNSGKAKDHIVSPKLSLIVGPWNKTEFFLNAGNGFHSNDARGTTQTRLPDGGESTPVTPLVKTQGSEIGMRSELLPGLQSSVSLWRLNIASELLFIGDAGETEASRASRRTGIEWNNHYIAAPWLLFDLDLAASRARYTQDDIAGNYIPGSIDKVASFGVTVNDLGRWYGGLEFRYFGPRPLIEDNTVRSNSTALAYGRVGYKIDNKTKLTLDVFNLFNRQASDIDYYYSSRLRAEPSGGVEDIHFHPVEPRTVRLTLSHQF